MIGALFLWWFGGNPVSGGTGVPDMDVPGTGGFGMGFGAGFSVAT